MADVNLEALWSVQFTSNIGGFGAGVAVFETGRVFGGDAQYYYLGTCRLEHDTVYADLTVTHHAGPKHSIFGPANSFRLNLTGKLAPTMQLRGQVVGQPGLTITINLRKLADLP